MKVLSYFKNILYFVDAVRTKLFLLHLVNYCKFFKNTIKNIFVAPVIFWSSNDVTKMASPTGVAHNQGKKLKVEEIFTSENIKDASSEESSSSIVNEDSVTIMTQEEDGAAATSSSVFEIQTPAQKALANQVILNHLFGLCPPDVLATCRLVSKQWHDESLVTWRSSFPITFTTLGNDVFCRHYNDSSTYSYISLEIFLRRTKFPHSQCNKKPYRYIKIASTHFMPNEDRFAAFWEALGQNITTMELKSCKFNDVEEFRKIIFKYCPNLKRLIFKYCMFPVHDLTRDEKLTSKKMVAPLYGTRPHLKTLEFYRRDFPHSDNDRLPISWLEILSHFQSLTTFKMDESYYSLGKPTDLAELETLAEAIQIIRKQNAGNLPFKFVYIDPTLTISQNGNDLPRLNIAQRLRLPIQNLSILAHPEMDMKFTEKNLRFFAKTLTWIRIRQQVEDPTLLMRKFPFKIQLQNLQKLVMEDTHCENFTFLKYMPNLRNLTIPIPIDRMQGFMASNSRVIGKGLRIGYEILNSNIVSNTPENEMAHVEMRRLTSLNLGVTVSNTDLANLFKWMPNVVKLHMFLNDEQFSIVCENWGRLRQLEVFGNWLTDKGLTGKEKQGSKDKRKKTVSVLPNITNLQSLEKFTYNGDHVTDDSVHHGFLKLPNLKLMELPSPQLNWGHLTRTELKKRNIELIDRSAILSWCDLR